MESAWLSLQSGVCLYGFGPSFLLLWNLFSYNCQIYEPRLSSQYALTEKRKVRGGCESLRSAGLFPELRTLGYCAEWGDTPMTFPTRQ
jgi:hypothetical protein